MNTEENNLASLLKQLRDDTTALVRDEIALAKTEMIEKVSKMARHGAALAAGVLLGFAALTPLLVGLGFALGILLVSWGLSSGLATLLGFLIVALITGCVSAVIVISALNRFKKESLKPRRTLESLKNDKNWIQNKLS